MNGKGTAFNERRDAVEPTITRNAERRLRKKAHGTQGRYVGKIQPLETLVVGDVQENGLSFDLWHGNSTTTINRPENLLKYTPARYDFVMRADFELFARCFDIRLERVLASILTPTSVRMRSARWRGTPSRLAVSSSVSGSNSSLVRRAI